MCAKARRIDFAPHDATIRTMVAGGSSWDAVATATGLVRTTVIEYCRRERIARCPAKREAAPSIWEGRDATPLPAGHPVAMAVLEQRA